MKEKKDSDDSLFPQWKRVAMAHSNYIEAHYTVTRFLSDKARRRSQELLDNEEDKPTHEEIKKYP